MERVQHVMLLHSSICNRCSNIDDLTRSNTDCCDITMGFFSVSMLMNELFQCMFVGCRFASKTSISHLLLHLVSCVHGTSDFDSIYDCNFPLSSVFVFDDFDIKRLLTEYQMRNTRYDIHT